MPVDLTNWKLCYFNTDCRIIYVGKHYLLDHKNRTEYTAAQHDQMEAFDGI